MTNSVDSHTVSPGDLLFGRKRLYRHLDERWAYLDALKGQSKRMDSKVQAELGRLQKIQRELADATRKEGSSAKELREAEDAVKRREEQGEYIQGRIRESQNEIAKLESDRRQAEIDSRSADARAASIQRENDKLTREIEAYESANNQTIQLGREALRRR